MFLSSESGPGLEVFKLQSLSTQCFAIMSTKHASFPGMFELNHQRDIFMNIMNTFNFDRKCANRSQMEALYKNKQFGGSLIESNKRIINQNPLKQIINSASNFGIYQFKEIKASAKTFYDIDILMTEKVPLLDKIVVDYCNTSKHKKKPSKN